MFAEIFILYLSKTHKVNEHQWYLTKNPMEQVKFKNMLYLVIREMAQ